MAASRLSTSYVFDPVARKSGYCSAGLPCIQRYGTVNPTVGCVHGCVYCYSTAFTNPKMTHNHIGLADDLPELITKQLKREGDAAPDRLYFSTSCDAFQPVDRIQDVTRDAILAAFAANRQVAFLTKGLIRDDIMEILRLRPQNVFAQVGVITVDMAVAALVEPRAPPPMERIAQAKMLVDAGIHTVARIDPILPGLTDTRQSLRVLFDALADAGIKHAVASYLFLRPNIRGRLEAMQCDTIDAVVRKYSTGNLAKPNPYWPAEKKPGITCMMSLPADRRQIGYSAIREVAAARGITVGICACKNEDIEDAVCCEIAGPLVKRMAAPPKCDMPEKAPKRRKTHK